MPIYDRHIRQALYSEFLNIPQYCTDDTIIVDELDICGGTSRIDIAVINGRLHGYEIKSEQDNLRRLVDQIDSYNLVFNTLYIAVSEKHISEVERMVPEWWGILGALGNSSSLEIFNYRNAKENPCVDGFSVAHLLWREELISLLKCHTEVTRSYHKKSRIQLAKIAALNLDLIFLQDYVRQALKNRTTWKSDSIVRQNGD
jgi:hypothetical protein